MRIGIIGTAGRTKVVHDKLSKHSMDYARDMVDNLIEQRNGNDPVTLVSGGSAWMDHVAVKMFIEACTMGLTHVSLTLYLPCAFDMKKRQFADNGKSSWRENPGASLNRYHRTFSQKVGYNSLDDLAVAHALGAKFKHFPEKIGFHYRNTCIATNVDIMLAFTFNKTKPPSGGTAHTWSKCKKEKIHFQLCSQNMPKLLK